MLFSVLCFEEWSVQVLFCVYQEARSTGQVLERHTRLNEGYPNRVQWSMLSIGGLKTGVVIFRVLTMMV